jgi:predicted Zn-dependent peptidase
MPLATYHVTTLENGLRVASAEMPAFESVSAGLWAGVGGRHESDRTNGAAHFLEHLLFKGTRRRTASAIAREVEGLGGDLNAFTGEDHTCFYAKAEARHLPRVADVLLDMYQHSSLPAQEVERERGVIREEILMGRDQPAQVAEELLTSTFWPDHPLGRPLTGTIESVARLRRADLLAFWRGGYASGNTVFTVAGPVTHREVVGKLRTELERNRRGPRSRFRRASARSRRREVIVKVERQDVEQVQLTMGFPGPGRHDPQRYVMRVVNAVLGENMSSRLFQKLREERGLCYSVHTHLETLHETGMFSVTVGLEAARLAESLELIRSELIRIASKPVAREELLRAKDYLIGQHRLNLESTTNQMLWMGETLLAYNRVVSPDVARARIAAVTAAEVQAAARRCFFGPGRVAVAAVGPVTLKNAEIARQLRSS